MARRHTESNGELPVLDGAARAALATKLEEIAFRRPEHEPMMLHIARTAGMVDVEKRILRLREYAKRARG